MVNETEKATSTKLLDAVNKEINRIFPKLTVHRRKAPTDFKRPCVLIRVANIENIREAAHILNTQIIIKVLVFEEVDDLGIPLEVSIKETLMEFLALGIFTSDGYTCEVKDRGADETGIAEIFDINFSKITILERKALPMMGEVKTRFGGN